jgi:hypothetical protein
MVLQPCGKLTRCISLIAKREWPCVPIAVVCRKPCTVQGWRSVYRPVKPSSEGLKSCPLCLALLGRSVSFLFCIIFSTHCQDVLSSNVIVI